MRRVNRWKTRLKWTGVGVLVSVAGAWFASGWWGAVVVLPVDNGRKSITLSIGNGVIRGYIKDYPATRDVWCRRLEPGAQWVMGFRMAAYGRKSSGTLVFLDAPLWAPWLVVAMLTAWAWYGSRCMAGHCADCGYDLSHIPSGVCPECGAKGCT